MVAHAQCCGRTCQLKNQLLQTITSLLIINSSENHPLYYKLDQIRLNCLLWAGYF